MADEAIGVSGLAGRYATALFELADERKALDSVATDLDALGAMLRDSSDLRRLVRSPVIRREDQAKAMAAIVERAGMGVLAAKFVGLLARNRRLFVLAAIIRAYRLLLAARRGEVEATVTSAVPLSDAQRSAVGDALKASLGREVSVTHAVDPSLLGGLVVRVGSRMIDSSLQAKLQGLKLAMRGTD